MSQSEPLNDNMRKALAALIKTPSVDEAAKECGLTARTLFNYLQNAAFRKELHAAQRYLVDTAISEMQAATSKAVKTLVRNLDCGNPFAENMAANSILSHSLKGLELRDVIARLDELEKQAKGIKRA